ncbi:hypothetical protein GDO81_013070 [Engystomops pustulosus]|uniref:Uncharacterized protein n=1 Tax=Engystomops pustulosus TaxID=76066 RepID=A0AAV7B1C1_ENGPU|nr:hypothetical protein GDO81_013070 [Engystomops pustulosus]
MLPGRAGYLHPPSLSQCRTVVSPVLASRWFGFCPAQDKWSHDVIVSCFRWLFTKVCSKWNGYLALLSTLYSERPVYPPLPSRLRRLFIEYFWMYPDK